MHRWSIPSIELAQALLAAGLLLAGSACGDSLHSARRPKPSASVATHPRATDRLARLLQQQLTAREPAAVERQVVCEGMRLYLALGADEARRRIRGVLDTIYKTSSDRSALRHANGAMAGAMTPVDSAACDSLITAANREDPISPAPTP